MWFCGGGDRECSGFAEVSSSTSSSSAYRQVVEFFCRFCLLWKLSGVADGVACRKRMEPYFRFYEGYGVSHFLNCAMLSPPPFKICLVLSSVHTVWLSSLSADLVSFVFMY